MALLGTRKFWRPDGRVTEPVQILKNAGYVSIVLRSAYYHARGTFWQRIFGGTDKIALSTSITYQSAHETFEASTIQDKREVRANQNHTLGLSRLIALKVPATADGLEMKVTLTGVKSDNLDAGLDLLNSDDLQIPLEMGAAKLGQVLAVTKIVKKAFTGAEIKERLDATFAGVIGSERAAEPLEKERLIAGHLVIIANEDPQDAFLRNMTADRLSVRDDGLKYDGRIIELTNVVYTVSLDPLKGVDERANWNQKYREALRKLDELMLRDENDRRRQILTESRSLWVEGNTLLDADPSYIESEQTSIKAASLRRLKERHKELTKESAEQFSSTFLRSDLGDLRFLGDPDAIDAIAMVDQAGAKYEQELAAQHLEVAFA